jgi:hypothetical protein
MDTGVHEHDGFYLRLALGLGRLGASFTSDHSNDLGGSVDGSLAHGAVTFELGVGGTPAPGLVIGGALYVSGAGDVTTHDLTVNGSRASDEHLDNVGVALLGPFVDYYIDAKLGWHVQGALGLASVNVTEGTRTEGPLVGEQITRKHDTGGLGFMVGGGYEWWIAKQWSMGALLRLMYASTETNKDAPERWSYKALSFPELLFSVTYH